MNTSNSGLIIKQYQSLGSAPGSFEMDNRFYTFQMNENFGTKFDMQATGGTQIW